MANFINLQIVFGLILFSATFGVYGTSPVLMWSNTNAFLGKNVQEVNVVDVEDIVSALRSQPSTLSKYFNADAVKPEYLFVFVEPKLSSEQIPLLSRAHESNPNGGYLSNLKNFVETSESSVAFPYVESSLVGDTILESFENVRALDTKQPFQPQIVNQLNNGVMDVFVVRFSSPAIESMNDSAVSSSYAADDAAVASIIASIQGSPYVAIFTSNGADSKVLDIESVVDRHSLPDKRQFRQVQQTLYITNWPVGVVEGLLISAPFIAILFVGVCCTLQLQSDLQFGGEVRLLKKVQ